MKKTILASAIAAASFSGAAMAAEHESNMPTVYGNIQYAITHDNVDGGSSEVEHADNGSTLGVKHDHEIAPGLKGFFKAELEFDADDKEDNNGLDSFDEAYIGVDSDQFGRVWIGSDDSTYETAIQEIANYYEVATLSQGANFDTGEGDLIQYRSPSFGGLTLGAAVQFNGDGEEETYEVIENGEVTEKTRNEEKSYPWQLAAMYEVDALELAFAVDSNDGDEGINENTYGLRASYNLDSFRLTGEYHTRKDHSDVFGVMGVYTLGANRFALSYEMTQYDEEFSGDDANILADNDVDTITLQALHNFSDNMYVYAEGYFGNGDDGVYGIDNESERQVAAVGAVYYF